MVPDFDPGRVKIGVVGWKNGNFLHRVVSSIKIACRLFCMSILPVVLGAKFLHVNLRSEYDKVFFKNLYIV